MAANITTALSGISGILVTPFDSDDKIGPKRLAAVIDRAVKAGVHILVANGNTGEFYGLTTDEAEAMAASVVEQVAGRVPVIAGAGKSVGDACRLARQAKAIGASAVMVHQPPDPFVAPRGVVAYVQRVADAADGLPVVLYLRNDAIGIDCIASLCAIDSVVGVKWATPNTMRLAAAIAACDPSIVWVGGLAEEMGGANVTGVKSALAMQGMDCGHVRPPSAWPLTDKQADTLKAFMAGNGLL